MLSTARSSNLLLPPSIVPSLLRLIASQLAHSNNAVKKKLDRTHAGCVLESRSRAALHCVANVAWRRATPRRAAPRGDEIVCLHVVYITDRLQALPVVYSTFAVDAVRRIIDRVAAAAAASAGARPSSPPLYRRLRYVRRYRRLRRAYATQSAAPSPPPLIPPHRRRDSPLLSRSPRSGTTDTTVDACLRGAVRTPTPPLPDSAAAAAAPEFNNAVAQCDKLLHRRRQFLRP